MSPGIKFLYGLLIAVFAFGAFTVPSVQAADPGVIQTLSGKRQFTVFAPTDAAFITLLGELDLTAAQFLSNQKLVTEVLLYHVARGNRNSNAVLGS